MSTKKSLTAINAESVESAKKSAIEMANKRGLILTGIENVTFSDIKLPSKNQQKEFARRLERVIEFPSMKKIALFLRMYSKLSGKNGISIDYSSKEKKIKEARKAYTEARKKVMEAYQSYKEEKGDFYKSLLNSI